MRTLRPLLLTSLLLLTLVVLPAQPATAASSSWNDAIDITFPVTGDSYRYGNDYRDGRGSSRRHQATDILAPRGTPIVATESGRITWMSTPATSGCGYCLYIRDGNGRTHGYIHMGPKSAGRESEAFAQDWREGDRVRRGQVIAYVGCSGNASCGGTHLHYLIQDPGVTDPYGDNIRNPYASLRAAECEPSAQTPFSDVCEDNVHDGNIGTLADERLTAGCNPPANDRFCPSAPVTREQMASFLIRALELSGRDTFPFRDVSAGNVHHRTIARLEAERITRGCDPDLYCPDDEVTREQMASFLVRALSLSPRSGGDFRDVSSGNVHRRDISALASAGITAGCNPPANDRFCPNDKVTRAQMASFLIRAFVD